MIEPPQSHDAEKPIPAPLLSYDSYVPARDTRSRRVIPAFWLGTMAGGLAYVPLFLFCYRDEEFRQLLFEAFLMPLMFSALNLLPATLSLGLCMWIRLKLVRQIRYASFKTSFFTGLVFGLSPMPLLRVVHLPEYWQMGLALATLGWSFLFPAIVGIWLAPRSALRD